MRKQEKLEAMLKKKSGQARPESPGSRRRKLKRNNSIPIRRSSSKLNDVCMINCIQYVPKGCRMKFTFKNVFHASLRKKKIMDIFIYFDVFTGGLFKTEKAQG